MGILSQDLQAVTPFLISARAFHQRRAMKQVLLMLLLTVNLLDGSPVPQDEDLPPMPYEFTNRVSEENADPNGVFWTQDEAAEESNPGRVDGSYSVWLPDGRLMTVTYYIDGDSGFVPEISYTDD